MSWLSAKIKIDFFRLITLKVVLIFLGLTIARMFGLDIDEQTFNSWTSVTMATLPSSSVKEGAEFIGNRRKYDERV